MYGREDQSEKILGRAMAIPIRTRIYPLKACISGLQSEVRVLSGRAVRMVHAMTSYKKVPWKEERAQHLRWLGALLANRVKLNLTLVLVLSYQ